MGKKSKSQTVAVNMQNLNAGSTDIESLVTSAQLPPVDLGRLVDWLNDNQHVIQSKNHL